METLNFTNNSFVLYQILPDHKKIDFLNQSFDGDITQITDAVYKHHMREAFKQNDNVDIPILSYLTRDGAKVNVFFYKKFIHVNSNKLKPIHQLVTSAMVDGNILILEPDIKKTGANRDQYHMRYYRVYKRVTPIDKSLPPIIFS